jgi:23S rRNA pseudouridine1911/1915/1917 synthase
VHGRPSLTGSRQSAIGRHPKDRKRMASLERGGKPAATSWRRVRTYRQDLGLLRVAIKTGRTHQIRVHLSEAGHPVVGDKVYGGRFRRRKLAGPAGQAIEQADRQLLHAVRLAFDHPMSGRPLELWAPLPPDFRRVLAALEKDPE